MKSGMLICVLTLITTGVASAEEYEVDQTCKTEGVMVKAVAKNAGLFSGAGISLICFEGRFAYARVEGFSEHNCLRAIARREGKDTRVAVKTSEGEPLCPGAN